MTEPNFFIVGAPKTGTTALCEYLRSHPNVIISQPKEPHYFAYDFPSIRKVTSLESYLQIFKDSTDKHLAIGEASVCYLYSKVAIKEIFAFNPDCKVIVMLRNPVELSYSLHSQLYSTFDEDVGDFEAAWRLQDSRRLGMNIPRRSGYSHLLQYGKVAELGVQMERLLEVVPRQQLSVVFFDDLTRCPSKVYQQILRFLGVPSDNRKYFPRVNQNKRFKKHQIAHLFLRPPDSVLATGRLLKKLGIRGDKVWSILAGWMAIKLVEKVPRQPLSGSFRKELLDHFGSDIAKLSRLLGKDLSHWK